MTDNEIIKALECCSQNNGCESCPYMWMGHCTEQLPEDALGLINRQNAEIDGLKIANEKMYEAGKEQEAEIERLCSVVDKTDAAYFQKVSEVDRAKAEAIKEFAERLKGKKERQCAGMGMVGYIVWVEDIDKTVKEMVGDAE